MNVKLKEKRKRRSWFEKILGRQVKSVVWFWMMMGAERWPMLTRLRIRSRQGMERGRAVVFTTKGTTSIAQSFIPVNMI